MSVRDNYNETSELGLISSNYKLVSRKLFKLGSYFDHRSHTNSDEFNSI